MGIRQKATPSPEPSLDTSIDAPSCEPIAIVGMAMRLPGGVSNGEEFWNLLAEKRSGLCDVPADRYNHDAFHSEDGKVGTVRMKQGYFLRDVNIQQFDTTVFSTPKTELELLDPQQRQLLEVAYECLENAGCTSFRGSNTGCYIGVFGEDWQDLNAKETQHMGPHRVTGYGDFVLGNRVSYEFDLHGPSMTVKTGCSSSLVGLDLACKAIRDGDCSAALVGGSSLIFSPTMTLALSDQGVLSPTGTCKTFDARADGYARGEAVTAIYIKKLSQALQDQDPIRAIIRSTSVNTDGRTQGMLTPSPVAQEALIRRAYEQAGISDLPQTALVECHGTGTAVGDPLETAAVAKCFGEKGVTITSVKPNVGHSEGAAGLTSLIKCVLALEHRQIPPNINFNNPNPKIPFDECRLHVPVELEAWPQDRAERASVNCFGIGGVNAHAIIESLGQFMARQNLPPPQPVSEQPYLLPFSGHSAASLEDTLSTYKAYIDDKKPALGDIAYTLSNRRVHHAHRAYAIADGASHWQTSSITAVNKPPASIAWVFTGQGAQWPEMGAELIDKNPVFQATIRKLDRFLLSLPTPPPWTIEDELRKPEGASRIHEAAMGHPLSIALQIGLIDVLRSWGIVPKLVLGHSSGEMAAAYASGSITAEGAMAAATFRGVNHETNSRKGSMAAIGLGPEQVRPYLEPGVVIACENSQLSVTLSGDTDVMTRVVNRVKDERHEVLARFLRVEKAFHSHHMKEYGPLYEEHIRGFVHSVDPPIPFYSAVTGDRLTGEGCLGPAYWRQNMESPVLFNSSLRAVLRDHPENLILIEIGPHPALKGPVGQILRDAGRPHEVHVGMLQRKQSCIESLLTCAGELFRQHVALDFARLAPPGQCLTNMPGYAWRRDTAHWVESRLAHDWRFRQFPPHELLGSRVVEMGSHEPCWRNRLALENVPWLDGHRVSGQTIFPAAGYICMIGEAMRQIQGGGERSGFSLRSVRIASAVVLESYKTTELLTSIRPAALDTSDQSPWYSFTISSFDGARWVRNCYGEARLSVDQPQMQDMIPALPRKVDGNTWYKHLQSIGFHYTGLFQGLQQISAGTVASQAAAVVPGRQSDSYHIHPATIDLCFQLFTVSAARGQTRGCRQLAVPTFIEEIAVAAAASEDIQAKADIDKAERGSFTGHLIAQSKQGSPVLTLKGFQSSALNADGAQSPEAPLITQLEWMPHAEFARMDKLMHPREARPPEWALLEELIVLCMLDNQRRIMLDQNNTPKHLHKFFAWQKRQLYRYYAGQNTFVPFDPDIQISTLSEPAHLARIESIVAQVQESPYAVFATAVHRLFHAATQIFQGAVHPLHILHEDDLLTTFYAVGDSLDYADAIQTLGNTNPQLRVLEVGAGTGGTTRKVLKALTSSYGERLYSSYTYTDVSAGFMTAAKELFQDYEGIEYAVLDVTVDPAAQGFELGKYDLIVASNVVHVTPSLQDSLRAIRSLLRPGGRLFLQELCPEAKFYDYVMGHLSGWWLGANDEENRLDQPYISPEQWSVELFRAGFQEPDAMVRDAIAPYHTSAGILASVPSEGAAPPARITLLCYQQQEKDAYVQEAQRSLEEASIAVDIVHFGDPLTPSQDVISLLDLHEPLVHGMPEATFKALVGYLETLKSRILWVTRSSQVSCEDPRAAMVLGFARTARNELSIPLYTVEMDTVTPARTAVDALARILLRVNGSPGCDVADTEMDPDWEFAIVNGDILVPRLHWQSVSDAFHRFDGPSGEPSFKQITIQAPGSLRTMQWADKKLAPLQEGEVRIRTKVTGLNFKDVLISLGVINNSTSELGLEGAGVVEEVGRNVHNLAIGDRVLYMSSGCFATSFTLPEALCVKIDESLSFELAASLPCVYATAAMALIDKANLQHGQSILIHSACGGVGLAAIQLAQMIGAEIYCTVSSEDKVQYLVKNHHIDRGHIFNSRDSSFHYNVMQATNGRGVDLVLNSLSGDLLHASWNCVASFGTMVEIGKRDFQRRAKLAMEVFEDNRTFVGLDLGLVVKQRPERAVELVKHCVKWIQSGAIRPDNVSHTFPACKIQEAFRFMQGGRHIGKIVITMPEDPQSLESIKEQPVPVFRPDRSYLLVGGLGGLGRAVAMWMVEHGARHLTFLSRSANPEKPAVRALLDELHSQGCDVQLVAGSVSRMADVEGAIKGSHKPIAGVINMSMVLRDVSLSQMQFSDWTTVVEPKVQGTWNLHQALQLQENPLDFFILYSSYSGMAGQWGQANYAAANTFLDAFVQYRHNMRLAASVIDIGVMSGIGFVSENLNILDHFQKSGMHLLGEQDLLDAMNLAVQRSHPPREAWPGAGLRAYSNPAQILLGLHTTTPITSPVNRVAWKRDMRTVIYRNVNGTSQGSSAAVPAGGKNSLRDLMDRIAAHPALLTEDKANVTAAISEALSAAVADFLIKDEESISASESLPSLGVDSLVAMELRNWIKQRLGVETTVFTLLQSPSLLASADQIREALVAKMGP